MCCDHKTTRSTTDHIRANPESELLLKLHLAEAQKKAFGSFPGQEEIVFVDQSSWNSPWMSSASLPETEKIIRAKIIPARGVRRGLSCTGAWKAPPSCTVVPRWPGIPSIKSSYLEKKSTPAAGRRLLTPAPEYAQCEVMIPIISRTKAWLGEYYAVPFDSDRSGDSIRRRDLS